jgi:hypothetical protein
MAHPLKHAESSTRKFGGKAEDSRFTTGLTNRRRSFRTFATALCVIMRRAFFWPRSYLASPS